MSREKLTEVCNLYAWFSTLNAVRITLEINSAEGIEYKPS